MLRSLETVVALVYVIVCGLRMSTCVNCVQCQEQACHVDESLYPHTFNPTLSLVSRSLSSDFYLLHAGFQRDFLGALSSLK